MTERGNDFFSSEGEEINIKNQYEKFFPK